MCRASAVHDVLLHAGLAAVLCISSVLAVSTYVHGARRNACFAVLDLRLKHLRAHRLH